MADDPTPFVWQGRPCSTTGNLMDAMTEILAVADPELRQRTAEVFMAEYRAVNPHAEENIGYLCGYYGHDEMVEALRLFQTAHPIFGPANLADKVAPEGAFESGKALGALMRPEARN